MSSVAASFESFRCYHLLQFLLELSDGSVVYQPSLRETEIMRLLRALGVCSDSCLDATISREKQLGLFINATNSSGLQVAACFGRQKALVYELQHRGWYPNNLEKYLLKKDEGIYAALLDDPGGNTPHIVIFSWLMDDSFSPDSLRECAAYALRLLTLLSSHLILCLSQCDWAQLEDSHLISQSMIPPRKANYSAKFIVESAMVENEAVGCQFVSEGPMDVENLVANTFSNTISGACFGVKNIVAIDEKILRDENMQTQWILKILKSHILEMKALVPTNVMLNVLDAYKALPRQLLEKYTKQAYHEKQQTQARTSVIEKFATYNDELTNLASTLFYQNEHLPTPTEERKASEDFGKTLQALRNMLGSINTIQRASLCKLDMRSAAIEIVRDGHEARLSTKANRHSQWFVHTASKISRLLFGEHTETELNFPFTASKEVFTKLYPQVVGRLLTQFTSWSIHLANFVACENNLRAAINHQISKLQRYEEAESLLLQQRDEIIFDHFMHFVKSMNVSKPGNALKASISMGKRFPKCSSERVDEAAIRISVTHFRLDDGSDMTYHIYAPLHSNLLYLSAVGNGALVAVFLYNHKTIVESLKGRPNSRAPILTKNTFPNEITMCDFDPTRRMLALLHSDTTVELFAFNESYKALEHKKQISLGAMRLQLPITKFLIFGGEDNGLMVTDSNGAVRTYHFRSRQISPSLNNIMTQDTLIVKVRDGSFVMFLSLNEDKSQIIIKTLITQDQTLLPETSVRFPPEWQWATTQAQVYGEYLVLFDPSCRNVIVYELTIATGKVAWGLQSIQHNNISEAKETHLLWSLFHCFEKFPVRSLMENVSSNKLLQDSLCLHIAVPSSEAEDNLSNVLRNIMSKLKAQNKPLYDLDLAEGVMTYDDCANDNDVWTRVSMNAWILELIGFVPVPICRANDNQLMLLQHGVGANYDGKDASAIAKQIDFGPISQVLQWWAGPVVVITSMGKQSTGKSYFLNHLTGSSFASSGARCTDGVWITVRALDKCLVVVLDFEGLGSFERTAQEDMLLSILNAAVSRLTVFRIEMRFDKDIDSMFSKFQQGVSLLKGDPRLFQGKLYLNAKDVNPNDQKSVVAEFFGKLQKILNENRSDNFVSAMYGGNVVITCAPPLGSMGYYDALEEAFESFEEARALKAYKNGLDFYDCLTMILAKISLLDWTGMESMVKEKRAQALRHAVGVALQSGQLLEGEDPVWNRSDKAISSQYFQYMQTSDGEDEVPMDNELDFDIDLYQTDNSVLLPVVKVVLLKYAMLFFQIANAKRTQAMEKKFDALLEFIVWRCEYRIRKWFGTLNDVDSDARDNLDACLTKFKQLFRRCQHTCAHCQLGCFESAVHQNSPHDCGTNHLCDGTCTYCEDQSVCGLTAGHAGSCKCIKNSHTCPMPCELNGASNCELLCHLVLGHEGSHLCSVSLHCCGQKCEAIECRGSCTMPFELSHTQHTCGAGRCQQLCTHPGCGNTCMSDDHFHPLDASHDCNNEHRCQSQCDEQGTCELKVHLEQTTETFHGKRATFTYVSKEMNGTRKQCATKLGVGCFDHIGNQHACDATIHYCTERCPCCEYFCEKEFGHKGLHKTSHGNMKKAHFVSDTNAFDIGDKKYEAGETGVAEMCPYFCSQMGRGHVHYVPCSHANAESCVNGCEGRRHCTEELLPAPETQMDEILHEAYWKAIGWEDPVASRSEREEFGLCPYKCCAVEHENDEKISYCTLNAWHAPLPSTDPQGQLRDHSIVQGHLFACRHQSSSGLKHHVFVLDASGSMGGNPWLDLLDAVHTYLNDQTSNNGQDDIVSIITFSSQGTIVFEGMSMDYAKNASIPFDGMNTYFTEGLRLAHQVFSRNDHEAYTPVLLFFSDGEPADMSTALVSAREISDEFDCFGLKPFFIGFGHVNHWCLENMAIQMGGTCLKAVSGIELVETFKQIAVSVQAKTGLLATNAIAA